MIEEEIIRRQILIELYQFWQVNAKEWMGGLDLYKAAKIDDEMAFKRNLLFLEDLGYVEVIKEQQGVIANARITAAGIMYAEREGIIPA